MKVRRKAGDKGVQAAGRGRGDRSRIQGGVGGGARDDQAAVLDREPGDLAAHLSEIARGGQRGTTRLVEGETAHHRATVLDPGRVEVGAADDHRLDRIVARGAELARGDGGGGDRRQGIGLPRRIGLHIAVPAADGRGPAHRRLGATGDVDHAVGPERDRRRLVGRPRAAALGPLFLATGVEHGDEAVGHAGRIAALAVVQRADHRSGDGDPTIRRDRQGVAAGLAGGAQHLAGDHLAGLVDLQQGDIALSLDRLSVEALIKIRHHPDRAVRRRGAGPHSRDALWQIGPCRLPFHPEAGVDAGLRRIGRSAVRLELDHLLGSASAGLLHHIDGVTGVGGGQGQGLAHHAVDLQRPLIRTGRQGDGLRPGGNGARLGLDLLFGEARGRACFGELGVDVADHGVHRSRLVAEVGQIDVQRLQPTHRLQRQREANIAFKRLYGFARGALVDRRALVDGVGLFHACGGLAGGGREPLHQPHLLHGGRTHVGGGFGQPRGESLSELDQFRRSHACLAGARSQRRQAGQALIEGEQLAVVGRCAFDVQIDVGFGDQAARSQRLAHQLALLGLDDGGGPGRRRLLLDDSAGDGRGHADAHAAGDAEQAEKVAVVDHWRPAPCGDARARPLTTA